MLSLCKNFSSSIRAAANIFFARGMVLDRLYNASRAVRKTAPARAMARRCRDCVTRLRARCGRAHARPARRDFLFLRGPHAIDPRAVSSHCGSA
jgi:hypothetical protein